MTPPSRAPTPSFATLPCLDPPPAGNLLDYLVERFPHVDRATWESRMVAGEVCFDDGVAADATTPYRPGARICYFRAVAEEPVVPDDEEIIFQNDQLVVVDKPHFLPVTPAGPWVNECLIYRLRRRLGLAELQAVHRLDRETAGLVLCSVHAKERGLYSRLFQDGQVSKVYQALARVPQRPVLERWEVHNRLERGDPWFRMRVVEGPPNARTLVELLDWHQDIGLFRLVPTTGKKHQLRLHMASLGFPIVHDRTYPLLAPEAAPDLSRPVQLLASEIAFRDPLSGEEIHLRSARRLLWSGRAWPTVS